MVDVRRLRLQRGWSQEQLAEMTGLSVRTIQRVEQGGTPSLETAKALAAMFEVDVQVLLVGPVASEDDAQGGQDRALQSVGPPANAYYWADLYRLIAHVAAYVLIAVLLSMASVSRLLQGEWIAYTLLGWGLGVVSHGCYVAVVVALSNRKRRSSA